MDIEMMKTNTAKVNEETITYPSGEKACLETIKGPYFDLNGDILGLIGVSRNITERKMKEEKIRYLNYHDVLTGVYNRAFLHKQLIELIMKNTYLFPLFLETLMAWNLLMTLLVMPKEITRLSNRWYIKAAL